MFHGELYNKKWARRIQPTHVSWSTLQQKMGEMDTAYPCFMVNFITTNGRDGYSPPMFHGELYNKKWARRIQPTNVLWSTLQQEMGETDTAHPCFMFPENNYCC
jgi:DNA-binding transcriptional regulator GbsR (MarR family)